LTSKFDSKVEAILGCFGVFSFFQKLQRKKGKGERDMTGGIVESKNKNTEKRKVR